MKDTFTFFLIVCIAFFDLLNAQQVVLDWEELGPANSGGRTRALIFDRDNPDKMLTGCVSGGLWMSTNAGANWSLIQDAFDKGCIAVASITQAANGDYYAGTGEGFYFLAGNGTGGIYGSGIFKSTDGGTTWNLCNGTAPPIPVEINGDWATVNRMEAHPSNANVIYALTGRGAFMTADGGETWAKVKDTNGDEINSFPGWDVKATSDGTVHMFTGNRYYRSVTEDTFMEMEPDNVPSTSGRKVLSISPSNPDLLYVATTGGYCVESVKRTEDGGDSWETIATGSPDFHPAGLSANQCQSNYDLTIAAHPTDTQVVFVGGLKLLRIGLINGIWQWEQIDNPGEPESANYVYPEKHGIVFKPGATDEMYIATDGGIYRTVNSLAAEPTFESRNAGYNAGAFYSVAADQSGNVFGGSQSLGSHFISCDNFFDGGTSLLPGFGGDVELSNIYPNLMFTSFPGGELLRSADFGENFLSNVLDCNIDCGASFNPSCTSDGVVDGNPTFIMPFTLWEDNDLYRKVRSVQLDANQQVQSLTHNGQMVVVTRNESLIPTDEDELYTDLKATLAESQIFIGWDESTNSAKKYGLDDYRYTRTRMFAGSSSLWMTANAHNVGQIPFWIRLGGTTAAINAISVSRDGNTVWAGANNGQLIRVNNLNEIDLNEIEANDPNTCDEDGIAQFEENTQIIVSSLLGSSGRTINSIATHPFDVSRVFVSLGGYGPETFVLEISNADAEDVQDIVVTDITGNLPFLPVFDLLVPSPNSNQLIAATETGIWMCEYDTADEPQWYAQNGGDMHPVPVFQLRQKGFTPTDTEPTLGCTAIYAGTYGRGLFRTSSLSAEGCSAEMQGGCESVNLGVEESVLAALSVFPNPTSSKLNLSYFLNRGGDLQVLLYDAQGRRVGKTKNVLGEVGQNQVTLAVDDLVAGSYFVLLRGADGQVGVRFVVSR